MESNDKKLSRKMRKQQNVTENKIPFELCIQKMLDEDFPLKFMYSYVIAYIVLSLISIVFQILSIVYSTPLYYYAIGIWSGALFLVIDLFTIVLISKRIVILYKFTILLNLLSPLIALCLWGINLIAVIDMHKRNSLTFVWINYVLFLTGVLLNVPSCVLVIIFKIKYDNYVKHFRIMSQFIQFV